MSRKRDERTQRREQRHMEALRTTAELHVNNDGRPDANFTGTLEDWDDRVFLHAVRFRVHRFGTGVNESTELEDFAQAMRVAIDSMRQNMRVIVYAVTKTQRYQALQPKRWEHYAKLYNDRKAVKHGRR